MFTNPYTADMHAILIYDYLMQVRSRVLTAASALTDEQYRRDTKFGLGSVASTLAHIMISEWYYVERLEGRDVPHYSQWTIQYETPPEFGVIQSSWNEQQSRIRSVIAAERNWDRIITWDSFADEQGKRFHIQTNAMDLFMQMVMHEVHHRAQVMSMLKLLGPDVPKVEDVDFSMHAYQRTPLG